MENFEAEPTDVGEQSDERPNWPDINIKPPMAAGAYKG